VARASATACASATAAAGGTLRPVATAAAKPSSPRAARAVRAARSRTSGHITAVSPVRSWTAAAIPSRRAAGPTSPRSAASAARPTSARSYWSSPPASVISRRLSPYRTAARVASPAAWSQ
jgi:hypothetical protein